MIFSSTNVVSIQYVGFVRSLKFVWLIICYNAPCTSVVSIRINQMSVTSTSFIMHVIANHHVTVGGAYSVYMHLHLYHTHTHWHVLGIKNNLISTSSIVVV